MSDVWFIALIAVFAIQLFTLSVYLPMQRSFGDGTEIFQRSLKKVDFALIATGLVLLTFIAIEKPPVDLLFSPLLIFSSLQLIPMILHRKHQRSVASQQPTPTKRSASLTPRAITHFIEPGTLILVIASWLCAMGMGIGIATETITLAPVVASNLDGQKLLALLSLNTAVMGYLGFLFWRIYNNKSPGQLNHSVGERQALMMYRLKRLSVAAILYNTFIAVLLSYVAFSLSQAAVLITCSVMLQIMMLLFNRQSADKGQP